MLLFSSVTASMFVLFDFQLVRITQSDIKRKRDKAFTFSFAGDGESSFYFIVFFFFFLWCRFRLYPSRLHQETGWTFRFGLADSIRPSLPQPAGTPLRVVELQARTCFDGPH